MSFLGCIERLYIYMCVYVLYVCVCVRVSIYL